MKALLGLIYMRGLLGKVFNNLKFLIISFPHSGLVFKSFFSNEKCPEKSDIILGDIARSQSHRGQGAVEPQLQLCVQCDDEHEPLQLPPLHAAHGRHHRQRGEQEVRTQDDLIS